MIRSLRRSHWRWMVALSILLPAAFLVLLGARDASLYDFLAPLEIGTNASSEAP